MTAKSKGTTFETAVVQYLTENGIPCERRGLAGVNDKGDIMVYRAPGLVIECKAEKKINLAGYMAELKVEIGNAGGGPGSVAVVKAPRKNVKDAYVTMTLEMYKDILKELIRSGYVR